MTPVTGSVTGWKTLSGEYVDDLKSFVAGATTGDQTVHIGTDSMQSDAHTQFVTVVAILTPGKGGRVLYRKERVPRIDVLRQRLLREVQLSVELGLWLEPVIKGQLTIAIDANPNIRYKSGKYIEELVGYVVGQGFRALIKPDSWAASHVADHIVRM